MESFTTYSLTLQKTIGTISKIRANYHLFSLNNTIRNKVIALGIRKHKMYTPYRRSRGGSTINRIRTHIGPVTGFDRSVVISNFQLLSSLSMNNGRVEYVHGHSTSLQNKNNINFSNLIFIELIQELPVLITDHSQDIPRQSGVDHNYLIKINPQQTAPNQIPNMISLEVINVQSICGSSGKTEDFIDHVTGGQVELCIFTETFLTEQNNVTWVALHPSGYAFKDQPKSNGDARGGTGIFHHYSFQVCKLSHGEKSSFEYSEWHVSWHNYCVRLCIIYHQPYSTTHPITDATFIHDFESYLDTLVLVDEMLCITGDCNLHIDDPTDTYGCQFNNLLSSYGLVNHITFPTHQAGHTLDLVITQNNQKMELRSIKPGYFLSDHCFVCVEKVIAQLDVQSRMLSYPSSNLLISPLLSLIWNLYVRIYY